MTVEDQILFKREAGRSAAQFADNDMFVGLGTGSTVKYTIECLGEMVRNGLDITGVATSVQTEILAASCGIKLVDLDAVEHLDIVIDGADEIDKDLNLIKGGGGALLREKMVAEKGSRMIVVADESKLSAKLGLFPLPIEVVRFGHATTAKNIADFGIAPSLRMSESEIFITDNGNYIYDCRCGTIDDPAALHKKLKSLTGVVETGLFIGIANTAIIGGANGVRMIGEEK